MYVDDSVTAGHFPQAGGNSSVPEIQAVYWRCVPVFFACAKRTNPSGCEFLLFTNADTLPIIDGVDIGQLLGSFGVRLVRLPFTYVTPQGFFKSWGNQFYIFDIIKYLHKSDAPLGVVLDSDCIINRPLQAVFRATSRNKLLTYHIEYPPDVRVNGIDRNTMRRIFTEMSGEETAGVPAYFGGEIFAASTAGLRELVGLLDDAWHANLDRYRKGLPKCNEEAHLLSYLYWRLGISEGTANPHIKRMWTQSEYRNVVEADMEKEIWHVPAEKRYGIRHLFRDLPSGILWEFDPGVPFRAYLAATLGIPRRTLGKQFVDMVARMRWRARRAITPRR